MNVLIPSEAVCLLEYYYLRSQDRFHCGEAPSVIIEQLLSLGLFVAPDDGGAWQITKKGQSHVYHMLHVPLPIEAWVLPEPVQPGQTLDEDRQ